MRKILLLSLLLAGAFTMFPAAEATAAVNTAAEAAPQWQQRGGWRWNDRQRRNRTYTQTITVRRGRYFYRETYRIRVRNGVVVNRTLVSRTRLYTRV